MTACLSGCTLRDKHGPDCEGGDCGGCLPRGTDVGVWCYRCFLRVGEALSELPELVVMVASRRDGKLNARPIPTADPTRVSKGGWPSPSPAWDTADDYIEWAAGWTEAVADYLTHRGPMKYNPAGLPMKNLLGNINYLRAQLPRIAEADFAGDFRDEVRSARRSLTYFTGTDRLMHRLKEACPSCDQKALVREDGSDRVECRNQDCGRIWLESEYVNLAHVAVS